MAQDTAHDPVPLTSYQRDVASWWNNRRDDQVNLALGEVDGIYHHHYGLGPVDPSVLATATATATDADQRDEAIIQELHRLETAQAELLLDHLGSVEADDRLLDAGSGRGGTSLMANRRFGCRVDGVSISEYQVEFANQQADAHGVADRVQFHYRNMLDTGLPTGTFRGVWTNETTMYVDLTELYGEVARLLQPGGRYVCITGCSDDLTGRSASVRRIDEHYNCRIHPQSSYFKAMAATGLVPVKVLDLTLDTIPYWELRDQSPVRTGIEEPFLTAYREGSFHYLLIVADRP
jgi:geranyl diphosphate 2-C-methyltransferase